MAWRGRVTTGAGEGSPVATVAVVVVGRESFLVP
jgi:hypothetical protein